MVYSGLFSSTDVGISQISVTDSVGAIGKVPVNVIPDPDTTIIISPTSAELNIGDDIQLCASDGTEPYSWDVIDSSNGEVNNTGFFTANNDGVCTIKVTDSIGFSNTAVINIMNSLTTDAGRSTTSPAAILFAKFFDKTFILSFDLSGFFIIILFFSGYS